MNIAHSLSDGRKKSSGYEKSWDIPAWATVHSSLSSAKTHTISQGKIVRKAFNLVPQNPHRPLNETIAKENSISSLILNLLGEKIWSSTCP